MVVNVLDKLSTPANIISIVLDALAIYLCPFLLSARSFFFW
jgi:hypothetical protein